MKSLLLLLGVVAFMYLMSGTGGRRHTSLKTKDEIPSKRYPGYSIQCYQCNNPCSRRVLMTCPEGLRQCYTNKTDTSGMVTGKGCTMNCIENEQIKCCNTSRCNK